MVIDATVAADAVSGRKPRDAARFNGTVVVEWLSVSGGLDVPVDWTMLHRELVREGYAYVAVSAHKVGIEGGPKLGPDVGRDSAAPVKKVDPVRYGGLSHPGDAFAFDIYSDVARLLRGRQRSIVLAPLRPRHLIAVGKSQSAYFLTSYVNAVDPLARAYDGFLIHSRSGIAAPLDGSSFDGRPAELMRTPIRLRPDVRAPTMQVDTETDVIGFMGSIGFHAARQPDSSRLRTWEVAGTAHADNYLFSVGGIDSGSLPIEQLAAAWRPLDNLMGLKLPVPMNNGPQHHYVTQAALNHLNAWVKSGKVPPSFAPLEIDSAEPPRFLTDAMGVARGGVRSPWVDVPIGVLSGLGAPTMMPLVGTSRPFDSETLARLYPAGRNEYLAKFADSLDREIKSGVILEADREVIRALARLGYPGKDQQKFVFRKGRAAVVADTAAVAMLGLANSSATLKPVRIEFEFPASDFLAQVSPGRPGMPDCVGWGVRGLIRWPVQPPAIATPVTTPATGQFGDRPAYGSPNRAASTRRSSLRWTPVDRITPAVST